MSITYNLLMINIKYHFFLESKVISRLSSAKYSSSSQSIRGFGLKFSIIREFSIDNWAK